MEIEIIIGPQSNLGSDGVQKQAAEPNELEEEKQKVSIGRLGERIPDAVDQSGFPFGT